MGIEVRPATGRWDDFASFMVPRTPGGRGCVCMVAIIVLAFIVHWAGGGVLNLRLGHFGLSVGFT
jgi:hypothetical protein